MERIWLTRVSIFQSDILPQTFFDVYGAFLWLMKIQCHRFGFFTAANLLLLKLLSSSWSGNSCICFAGMMACSAACNWQRKGLCSCNQVQHFSFLRLELSNQCEMRHFMSQGFCFCCDILICNCYRLNVFVLTFKIGSRRQLTPHRNVSLSDQDPDVLSRVLVPSKRCCGSFCFKVKGSVICRRQYANTTLSLVGLFPSPTQYF